MAMLTAATMPRTSAPAAPAVSVKASVLHTPGKVEEASDHFLFHGPKGITKVSKHGLSPHVQKVFSKQAQRFADGGDVDAATPDFSGTEGGSSTASQPAFTQLPSGQYVDPQGQSRCRPPRLHNSVPLPPVATTLLTSRRHRRCRSRKVGVDPMTGDPIYADAPAKPLIKGGIYGKTPAANAALAGASTPGQDAGTNANGPSLQAPVYVAPKLQGDSDAEAYDRKRAQAANDDLTASTKATNDARMKVYDDQRNWRKRLPRQVQRRHGAPGDRAQADGR